MIKLIFLMTIQCIFLVSAQVFLKLGLTKFQFEGININLIKSLIKNPLIWICFLCMGLSGIVWFYVIKNYRISLAYPLVSISYIFMLIAAIYVFHETVPFIRWIGVIIIIVGIILVCQK